MSNQNYSHIGSRSVNKAPASKAKTHAGSAPAPAFKEKSSFGKPGLPGKAQPRSRSNGVPGGRFHVEKEGI